MIKVEIIPKTKTGVLSTPDKVILGAANNVLDGSKARNRDMVMFPLRAIVNLENVTPIQDVLWGPGAREMYEQVLGFKNKRSASIREYRAQYPDHIEFDYDFKGKFPPLAHQKVMYNIIRNCDCSAILADPGTCKTGPYLWAIEDRLRKGVIKKAVVITLSPLKKNVVEEAGHQVPGLRVVAVKSVKDWDAKIEKPDTWDVLVVSYESIRLLKKLDYTTIFQMIVMDEAHRIGSNTSKQTKAIYELFEKVRYRYIATGTLHANNSLSFYMPIRFLGPDVVTQSSYYGFRAANQMSVDPEGHIWVDRGHTKPLVAKIIGDIAVRFKKEECLDLPDLMIETRFVDRVPEQRRIYDEYVKEKVAELKDMCDRCSEKPEAGKKCERECDKEVAVSHILTMTAKLRQMASGFYINTIVETDDNGKEVNRSTLIELDSREKFKMMDEIIDSIPDDEKIIIWSDFVWVVEEAGRWLRKRRDGGVVDVVGSDDTYDKIQEFKKPGNRYLNAMTSKAGVGQNCQFSSYQIFLTNGFSYVKRDQAISRQYRQGQKNNVTVYDIVCRDTIDERIMMILKDKQELGENLSSTANPNSVKEMVKMLEGK